MVSPVIMAVEPQFIGGIMAGVPQLVIFLPTT